MIVVKILWDIVKVDDITLIILPPIHRYTHEAILQSFRESIHAINCKMIVALVLDTTSIDTRLYEDTYDKEVVLLKDLSYVSDPSFLKHHDPSIVYLLQNFEYIFEKPLFTKIIMNTLNCNETILEKIKSLNVPTHYGLCVFQEIITAKIFIKSDPYIIHGKTTTYCDFEEIYHFYCDEEGNISRDTFNDIVNEIQGIPIFVGTFRFYDEKIKNRWDAFFSERICIYDLDAFECLKPTKNYRLSKDITNLIQLYMKKNSDLLSISANTNE